MTEIAGYENLEVVGRGGSAVVYKARQISVGRDVAIKLLTDPAPDDDLVRRFQRESQAVGALSWHPHIAAVVDAGSTSQGQAYIVFELLPGGSLEERIAIAPMPWFEAVSAMIQVADAVEAAHGAEVLHRDIKPANILMDRLGVAKLGDFGIASMQDGTKTATGMLATTVAYAAPELFDGESASPATDVYALGATLHALVTGTPPFSADPMEPISATIAKIMAEPPPPLDSSVAPAAVSTVIAHALAKQPQYRPRSAAAFGQALQQAQHHLGQPVTAMPVTDSRPAPSDPAPSSTAPVASPAPADPPPPAAPEAEPALPATAQPSPAEPTPPAFAQPSPAEPTPPAFAQPSPAEPTPPAFAQPSPAEPAPPPAADLAPPAAAPPTADVPPPAADLAPPAAAPPTADVPPPTAPAPAPNGIAPASSPGAPLRKTIVVLTAVALLLAAGIAVLVLRDRSDVIVTRGGARIATAEALPATQIAGFEGRFAVDLDDTTYWGIAPAADGTEIRGTSFVITFAEEQNIVRVGISNGTSTSLGRVTGVIWGTSIADLGRGGPTVVEQELQNAPGEQTTEYRVTTRRIAIALTGVYDDAPGAGIAEILIEVEE